MPDRPGPEGGRLTRKQREALAMLDRAARQRQVPHGVVSAQASAVFDSQPWIHWRTVLALQRRGLVRIEWFPPDGGDVYLAAAEVS